MTKELRCTYRFPRVLRDGLANMRMRVAHDARHDRKSNFCDFLWWILLITHDGGRIKSRIACTKSLEGGTLVLVTTVGFFSGVVRLVGRDGKASRSGLDSDILALSGCAYRVVGGVQIRGRVDVHLWQRPCGFTNRPGRPFISIVPHVPRFGTSFPHVPYSARANPGLFSSDQ